MRLHISPKQGVHSRLVARALRLELDDILVDTQRQQPLWRNGHQSVTDDGALTGFFLPSTQETSPRPRLVGVPQP